MGRHGRQAEPGWVLLKRGSARAAQRIEQEKHDAKHGDILDGVETISDQILHALADYGRHHQSVPDIVTKTGIGKTVVQRFLKGDTVPTGDTLNRLCVLLGLRLVWCDEVKDDLAPEPVVDVLERF